MVLPLRAKRRNPTLLLEIGLTITSPYHQNREGSLNARDIFEVVHANLPGAGFEAIYAGGEKARDFEEKALGDRISVRDGETAG